MVDDTTLCSIRNLVEYLQDDEERHYSECDENERKNHIYNDVLIVRKWLDSEPDMPTMICPVCKKRTLRIHGEGITSDNRHYPIEECRNCGFVPKDFSEYSGTVGKESLDSEVKGWLLDKLESWDFTFEEETEIPDLMKKIEENSEMTSVEYEAILFHLWQSYYGEE